MVDIETKSAELETKAADLEMKAAALNNLEDRLRAKLDELDQGKAELAAHNEEITEREMVLDVKEVALTTKEEEIAAKEQALKPPRSSPVDKGPRRKFVCIRKCYHPISADKPETRKIYMPGDSYFAFGNEQVPRHFKEVKTSADEHAAQDEIDRQTMVNLPPHLAKKQKTVHG